MTREEKVAKARILRASGLKLREIAAEMGGVAISTVDTWLNDPDLSRQRERRKTYGKDCIDCGKRTDGSNGYDSPERCYDCYNEHHFGPKKARDPAAMGRGADRQADR